MRVDMLHCLDEEIEMLLGEVGFKLNQSDHQLYSDSPYIQSDTTEERMLTKNEQAEENDSSEDEDEQEEEENENLEEEYKEDEEDPKDPHEDEKDKEEEKPDTYRQDIESKESDIKQMDNEEKEKVKTEEIKSEEEVEKVKQKSKEDPTPCLRLANELPPTISNQKKREINSTSIFQENLKTKKQNDAFIRKHMKLKCDDCLLEFDDFTKLKNHFRLVHKSEGFAVCCNRQLKKRSHIVDHIIVHNEPDYFKCKECGKVLSDRNCLQRHMILSHQTEESKKFLCSRCPKKFPTQKLLDHHIVKHNECTHICSECGKGYPTKKMMQTHFKRIHSTLCDRMCEICAKLIKGKANFMRHMEEHEGKVQPKVQCNECGSWFKDKNSLRKHTYSKHDGKTHVCKICGKTSPSYSALYSHMRYMHELSNEYSCSFCDKSFKMAIKLKEHVATHEGGFLYECPHCPSKFNAKTNMHSHRKKVHPKEWEENKRYERKTPC